MELENKRIMIVDDEEDMLDACLEVLEDLPLEISCQTNPRKALKVLEQEDFHLVISDLKMEEMSGLELVRRIRKVSPITMICMITAYPTIETAVEAVKLGAYDYLTKPFTPDQLILMVQRGIRHGHLSQENEFLYGQLSKNFQSHSILGTSPALAKILRMAEKVAPTPVDILLTGESGTGKALLARHIHQISGRKGKFVPVDCGVIPENLMENELFGHEKGAFSGAVSSAMGLVELAHKGSLFLDELGELPPSMQVKLLRVLQEKRFRKVGGKKEISVDLRVIAATNRNLKEEMMAGRFREDLFYRIHVVHIHIPPLRNRKEDIGLMIDHYLALYGKEFHSMVRTISESAREILMEHPWHGNVRELQNVLKKAIIMTENATLQVEDLPKSMVDIPLFAHSSSSNFAELREKMLADFEQKYLRDLLSKHRGEVSLVAEEAHIPLATLYRLLKKHHISWKEYKERGG